MLGLDPIVFLERIFQKIILKKTKKNKTTAADDKKNNEKFHNMQAWVFCIFFVAYRLFKITVFKKFF